MDLYIPNSPNLNVLPLALAGILDYIEIGMPTPVPSKATDCESYSYLLARPL